MTGYTNYNLSSSFNLTFKRGRNDKIREKPGLERIKGKSSIATNYKFNPLFNASKEKEEAPFSKNSTQSHEILGQVSFSCCSIREILRGFRKLR